MTRAIGPAAAHVVPEATPPRPARTTKSTEKSGFAQQLHTLLEPRTVPPTTPAPRRPPSAPPGSETNEAQDDGNTNEGSHTGTSTAPSSASHTASAPGAQASATAPAPAPPAPAPSGPHTGQSATDSHAGVDETLAALAGWIAMRGQLDTPGAAADTGHIPSPETKRSQSSSLAQAASKPDRSVNVVATMSRPSQDVHSPEPVRETAHTTNDSSTSDTQEMQSSAAPPGGTSGSPRPQASEAQQVPAGVTILALSCASSDVAAPPAKDRNASTSVTEAAIDGAVAAALTAATTTSETGTSPSPTSSTSGAAQPQGPDVSSAVAANTIAPALADRITVQLPTDQGSARIQIAVSNGTVITRIMMPDATSAAHLSAASGELHDALTRQGFDAVKIAIPAPPSSGLSPAGHPSEQSSDRTPDRAPQQSFTSAQDRKTTGRPQQRPRRQRER